MTGPKNRVEAAETEAAEWHARLGAKTVTTQTIEDFFAWRGNPANADAYRRVELAWGGTQKLAGDPKMRAALEDALNRSVRGKGRRRAQAPLIALASLGAAAVLAFGGWTWLQARTVFATTVGEQRLVQLADGSSVRLDTNSRIRVRFEGDQRRIQLETGQALFTVARDADRPFVVEAGEARVTAIGTVFDVRRETAGTSVTLVSGIVEVAAGKDVRRMTAGQQARATSAGTEAAAVDVDAVTSWTEGRIVFRDVPLSQAVDEVNRYLTAKVELDSPSHAGEPVNGVFKTGDRDAFVSVASEVFGLRISNGADGTIRLSEPG